LIASTCSMTTIERCFFGRNLWEKPFGETWMIAPIVENSGAATEERV
jgi:hypothetical protein